MTVKLEGDADHPGIWIFGFGSLIYKAGFEYQKRVEGYIKDYRRVFFQGSTDHRGVPGAPGRVVTLAHDPGKRCWGVAYLLDGTYEEQQKTLKYLEWREKQYDVRERVDVFGRDSASEPLLRGALVYIASEDRTRNLNYLGTAPWEAIARQIAAAVGPSGRNDEYLFGLADALEQMGVHEEDLVRLAARVRQINAAGDVDNGGVQGAVKEEQTAAADAQEAEKDLHLAAAREGSSAAPGAAFVRTGSGVERSGP